MKDCDDLMNIEVEDVIEEYGWNNYIPESVTDEYQFFAEMAEIYPRYNHDNNIKNDRFKVCVFEGKEGPIPHVHIFFDHKDSKNHGNTKTVSYVCLATAEYAPQHEDETKILNSHERKALSKFFSTEIPNRFAKDKNGNLYQVTCWEECVQHWIDENPDSEKFFKIDKETGLYVMPDYKTISKYKKGTNDICEGFDLMNIEVDESVDLLNIEIDEPFLEMAKVVTGVVSTGMFSKRWAKLTNGKNTGVLEKYLLEHYETNNPVIKEDRFKKYKELSQCRKLRWNSKSNKASQTGDIRVINAYIPSREKIYLVLCYSKSVQEDLTSSQVKNICDTIKYLNENQEVEDECI